MNSQVKRNNHTFWNVNISTVGYLLTGYMLNQLNIIISILNGTTFFFLFSNKALVSKKYSVSELL